ncbi:MAG: DUF2339 domain-containing protein, partial [Acidobacteria bacterium]|nr:DUF2339 domain-containing protein [Acidobacteriota bacterium]
PLLLALYLVAVPNYGAQTSIVFGFLLVVDAGLLAIAWRGGPRWLHAAGGVATLAIFWLWLRLSYTPQSWPWPLLWLALFIALYLVEVTPFAALLFGVFIGLAQREPYQQPAQAAQAALLVVMLALIGLVLQAAMRGGRRGRRGRPLTAALAIALAAMTLMILQPALWLALALHAVLLAALFAVAWIFELHLLAILAIPFYMAAVIAASYLPGQPSPPALALPLIALVPYALFIAYPLALGARAREAIAPYLAAALASLVFCLSGWSVRHDLAADRRYLIGLVPLAAAAAMLALLWRLRTLAPQPRRFTLVAAAALAFFSVSIPMLLPKQWAVLAWALAVVALVWLFGRVKQGVLLASSVLLAGAVLVWLALDADLFTPWPLYAVYTTAGVAMIAAAYLARSDAPAVERLLSVAGLLELWFLLNLTIANCSHATNGALAFDFVSTPHAADASYTVAWAVIATGLFILGWRIAWPAARGAALALLLATIAKCLLNDLPRLRGLYLVASLLGLALSLALVSIVLAERPGARAVDVPARAGDPRR